MLLVLLAVPIVEILVAAMVAQAIGWGWTVLLLVVLSLVGVWQLKVQGLGAWRAAVEELNAGESPAAAVIGGALRVLGAGLIIVPGFVTAVVGLALLWNPIRGRVADRAGRKLLLRVHIPWVTGRNDRGVPGAYGPPRPDEVVDVDGWEEAPRNAQGKDQNVLGRADT